MTFPFFLASLCVYVCARFLSAGPELPRPAMVQLGAEDLLQSLWWTSGHHQQNNGNHFLFLDGQGSILSPLSPSGRVEETLLQGKRMQQQDYGVQYPVKL